MFANSGAGCARHPPRICSEECAARWMPFASHCSEWAKQEATAAKLIAGITQQCEVTVYGRYSGGGGGGGRGAAARPVHGRCSDSEYADWTRQLSPACCGADLQRVV